MNIAGLVAALNTALPAMHNVGTTQLLQQAEVQQSNNEQLPVHLYKAGILLAIIPLLVGWLMAGIGITDVQEEDISMSDSMSVTFLIFVGVSLIIIGIVSVFRIFRHWSRCPSCNQHWAVTPMKLQSLHNLRVKNIMQNLYDPTVGKTAQLLYRCKHCGHEWIYQWD